MKTENSDSQCIPDNVNISGISKGLKDTRLSKVMQLVEV